MGRKETTIGIILLGSVVLAPISHALGEERQASTEASISFNNKTYQYHSAENDVFLFSPDGEEFGGDWTERLSIITVPRTESLEQLMQVVISPSGEQNNLGDLVGFGGDAQTGGPPKEILLYFEKEQIDAIEFSAAKLLAIDGTGVIFVYSYRALGVSAYNEYSKWQESNTTEIDQSMKRISTSSILEVIAIVGR